jgi:hypothetical protein
MKLRWLFLVCTLSIGFAFTAVSAQGTCQDATGASVPCTPASAPTAAQPDSDGDGWPDADDRCPTQSGIGAPGRADCPDPDGDFITNDGDLCPNEPGPAETGGCPSTSMTPISPEPTAVPAGASSGVNPLRPPTDGECALTTRGLERVNVRSAPEVDAPIIGALEPSQVYPVDAVVIRRGVPFVRTGAHGGGQSEYVRLDTVLIGGRCAFDQIGVAENAGYVAIGQLNDLAAGTLPLEQCVDLLNGAQLCDLILPEVNADGSTEGKGGKSKLCKGLKGWLICTALEIVLDNACLLLDCPGPNPGGYDDPGDSQPGDGDAGTGDAGQDGVGDGQVYCNDLIGELTAAAAAGEDGTPPGLVSMFDLALQADPGVRALLLPAINNRTGDAMHMEVGKCLLELDAIQPMEAAGGIAPYDRIRVEVNLPLMQDTPLTLFALSGRQIGIIDRVLLDENGDVCLAARAGDFSGCPLPPDRFPVADLPLFSPLSEDSTDRLVCDYSDPNDSYCLCDTPSDCIRMVQNFCAGPAICSNWPVGQVCSCDA